MYPHFERPVKSKVVLKFRETPIKRALGCLPVLGFDCKINTAVTYVRNQNRKPGILLFRSTLVALVESFSFSDGWFLFFKTYSSFFRAFEDNVYINNLEHMKNCIQCKRSPEKCSYQVPGKTYAFHLFGYLLCKSIFSNVDISLRSWGKILQELQPWIIKQTIDVYFRLPKSTADVRPA